MIIKNQNQNQTIFRLTLLGCFLLSLFSSSNVLAAKKNPDVPTIDPAAVYQDSYFQYEDTEFTVKIGDKNLNNNSQITFTTVAEKQTTSLIDSIIQFFGGQTRYSINFDLAGKGDAKQSENIVKNIFKQDNSGIFTIDQSDRNITVKEKLNDVDAVYSIIPDQGLKEDIIVKGAKQVDNTYFYKFKLDPEVILFKAAEDNDFNLPVGTYYFTDLEKNYVAHLLPIQISDALGASTNEFQVNFIYNETDPTQYVMSLTIDDNWLYSKDRQYPVTIDPTIVHDTQGEFTTGQLNRVEVTTAPRVQLTQMESTADINTGGLWHFDDATGQVAADATTNANDGQLGATSGSDTADPAWDTTNQKVGDAALDFDGTSDYVIVPDDPSLQPTQEMVLEAWVKGTTGISSSWSSTQQESQSNTAGQINNVAVQVDGNKIYYFYSRTYIGNTYFHTAYSNLDGTGWTSTQQESRAVGSGEKNDIDFQVVGNKIYYFYSRSLTGTTYYYSATSNLDGSSWSSTQQQTLTNSSSEYNHVALQVSNSKIYYFFSRVLSGSTYYHTANANLDGTGWTSTQQESQSVSSTQPHDISFQVVDNKIYYFYSRVLTGTTYYRSAYSNLDGTGWSSTQQDSQSSGSNEFNNVDMKVAGNKIYYFYSRSILALTYFHTAYSNLDGTGWSSTQQESQSNSAGATQDLAMQVNGDKINYFYSRVYIANAYYHTASANLDGSSWSSTQQESRAIASGDFVSVDMYTQGGRNYYFYSSSQLASTYFYTATNGGGLVVAKGSDFSIGITGSKITGTVGGAGLSTLIDSDWNLITLKYDGSQVELYKNNILQGTASNLNGITITGGPLLIGYGFDGLIDEVRLDTKYSQSNPELRPYGIYTSDVIDLGTSNPTLNSLSWNEYGVRTGDGETDLTTNGLVAKWNFNETSGTSASDASGNSHTGTLTNFASTGSQDAAAGTGWTASNKKWGAGSLMFDGSDDFVAVTGNLGAPTNITLNLWAKYFSVDTGGSDIFSIGDHVLIRLDNPTNGITGYFYDGAWRATISNEFRAGTGWHMLTYTMDDTNNIQTLYIDGNPVAVTNFTTSINYSGLGANTTIGKHGNGSANYDYNGVMDAVSVYSRALGQDEILSLYQAGQVEIQTRTGTDSTPENGGWEAWTPTDLSVAAQMDDMDDNEENTNIIDWSLANIATDQQWIKVNNQIPSASDTTSTDGRIPLGTSGRGDDAEVGASSVLYDNGTYKMWYLGKNINNGRIFYATSPDGYNWTKYDNTISGAVIQLSANIPGNGDSKTLEKASVIKDGSTYKMWYSGYGYDDKWRIYYATSPDGITWTKYDNTIPPNSNTTSTNGRIPTGTVSGNGDGDGATNPYVIKDGSTYKMWYQGYGSGTRIYMATSPDGLTWTKVNNASPATSDTTSTEGRIPMGSSGKGDVSGAHDPMVIKEGNIYKMWYAGRFSVAGDYRIYYATSSDGLTWNKYNNTLTPVPTYNILTTTDGRVGRGFTGFGDDTWVAYPSVVKTPEGYKLWYRGVGVDGYSRIFMAEMAPLPTNLSTDSNIKIEGDSAERCIIGQSQVDGGTVALWHLDETGGSGAYIKDSSGNGYNGTPTGTTVVNGKNSKARNFNGATDKIQTSSPIISGTGDFTISGWIKRSSTGTVDYIAGNYGTSTCTTGMEFYISGDVLRIYIGGSLAGTTIINADQWHHVAVTRTDGVRGKTVVLYVDGKMEVSAVMSSSIGTNCNFAIGNGPNYTTENFNGSIDELKVSNIGRTAEEIAEEYRAGAGHYLTRSLASTYDLSSNNKLSYYIASDSPGTHISSFAGESPYANGQPDTNTVGLWHLDGDQYKELSYNLSGTTIRTSDWIEIDPNAKISQNNGIILSSDTTNAWDSALISQGTFKREPGKTIYAKFTTSSSVAAPNYMMIGWGQNQTTSANYPYLTHALYFVGGAFSVYQDGTLFGTGYGSGYAANTAYEVKITLLNTGGARYEIKGGAYTNWTVLLSTDSPKTSEILRVQIINYRHTGTINAVSVLNNSVSADSSIYNNEARVFSAQTVTGQEGDAKYFDGSNNFVQVPNNSALNFVSAPFTISTWVKLNPGISSGSYKRVVDKTQAGTGNGYGFDIRDYTVIRMLGSTNFSINYNLNADQWYHLAIISNGSGTGSVYVNGQLAGSGSYAHVNAWTGDLHFGKASDQTSFFDGSIDDVRIDNIARTPEEIRQAYEVGKRTHSVTIDFGASLDSGNDIDNSGDTSFTVDATAYGLSQKGANLFIGDKIIVRENYNGTEYIAQGTVDSVNTSTGAVTVASWDTGSTFPPTVGFQLNADVFKWQREYFDIAGAMPTHVDAVDELSFQFLDGNAGRTFWIDDISMIQNNGYLTDNLGATISSTPHQYIQYRALLTTTDPDPTPALGPITLDYTTLEITGGSTSQSYLNTNNNTAFNTQCNGVTDGTTGQTVYCQGSWNQTNWFNINSDTSPLTGATIQGTPDVSGWTDYPLGNGTVTIYVRAENNGNYSNVESFTVEKDVSRPAVTAISSVAGDTSPTYYDTTDDSSTLVIYTADADATSCKWDETDLTYGAMANTCSSTTNCTLNLSGDGAKTVYFRCLDTAGNYSDTSYQLNYTVDSTPPAVTSITSVAGDTSAPYKDGTDNSSTAVVYTASADAASCKWDETDLTYGAMASTCSTTSSCDLNLTGEGAHTIYMRCLDNAGNTSTSSYQLDYTIDTTPPVISSIISVAGDTAPTYYDTTDNNATQILFNVSADADQCKWDAADVAFDTMANTCTAAGDCTANLSGDGAKTIYIRCKDDVGNKMTTSTQVDYTIDSTPPAVTSITSVAGDTVAPYFDTTDDSSTAIIYTASADAVSCKWDETDLTYGAMANTCTDTANCTLDLTGEGAHTIYMRCLDLAGLTSTSSYQLDYTIDTIPPSISSITDVAGDTVAPYYDTTDNSSTVTNFISSADTAACKWDTSDTIYDSMTGSCTSAAQCDFNLTGDGAKTVYLRCIDNAGNKATSSYTLNYTIDATPPAVTSITSVAGDSSAPYKDNTDNSSTAVVYTASADAVSCKWDESDLTYGAMTNTCTDTSNCTLDLTGEGAHTVYFRCLDIAGNPSTSSYQLDYTIDTTPPAITSITDVAGDSAAPYFDTTDNGSTLVNFATDSDAVNCKWSATAGTAYDSMTGDCGSASQCTLNLTGETAHTVYFRCVDDIGNKATTDYQLDYTIDATPPTISGIISVAGDAASTYYDNTDNGATQILFNVSADTAACRWSTSDQAYDSMSNICTAAGDCTANLTGETGHTVYIRCADNAGNKMTSSTQVDYIIDATPANVLTIISVEGDTQAPYVDIIDDDNADIVYTATADAVSCKWDYVNDTYDNMNNTCATTSSCTINHTSDGAKTIYFRCLDIAGNKSPNSYQLDYEVDELVAGGGIRAQLDTSQPQASGNILITFTPDLSTVASVTNGSIKIRLDSEYDLSALTVDDVVGNCGDVTFTNTEIIYDNGIQISYHPWSPLQYITAYAAGEDAIVFPFIGTLDATDGQCSFTIGGTHQAVNPNSEGAFLVSYDIYDNTQGFGTPVEFGDGMVHLNHIVVVTATVPSILQFSINPVTAGGTVNGATITTATTSGYLVNFGGYTGADDRIAAHDLQVSTNATDGYIITVQSDQSLSNGIYTIPDFTAANNNPQTWATPPGGGTNGYFGYTTSDDSLFNAPYDRFTGNKWAGFSAIPSEVAFDSGPVRDQITRVGYRLELTQYQNIGTYQNTLMYIVTPTY